MVMIKTDMRIKLMWSKNKMISPENVLLTYDRWGKHWGVIYEERVFFDRTNPLDSFTAGHLSWVERLDLPVDLQILCPGLIVYLDMRH